MRLLMTVLVTLYSALSTAQAEEARVHWYCMKEVGEICKSEGVASLKAVACDIGSISQRLIKNADGVSFFLIEGVSANCSSGHQSTYENVCPAGYSATNLETWSDSLPFFQIEGFPYSHSGPNWVCRRNQSNVVSML